MAKYKKNADLEDENQRLRQEMEDLAHLLADAREVAAQKDKQLAQAKRSPLCFGQNLRRGRIWSNGTRRSGYSAKC